ncbi:hypothetical protein KR084_005793 [Drosophila pseudotakahashii]|nr:hypothetical protein KR084_005793 [Drosophila pseudotakahashii]
MSKSLVVLAFLYFPLILAASAPDLWNSSIRIDDPGACQNINLQASASVLGCRGAIEKMLDEFKKCCLLRRESDPADDCRSCEAVHRRVTRISFGPGCCRNHRGRCIG